jgi:hypothetical protein
MTSPDGQAHPQVPIPTPESAPTPAPATSSGDESGGKAWYHTVGQGVAKAASKVNSIIPTVKFICVKWMSRLILVMKYYLIG